MLKHEGKPVAGTDTDDGSQVRTGKLEQEYALYRVLAGDENGLDVTGKPLKTFDEWLDS